MDAKGWRARLVWIGVIVVLFAPPRASTAQGSGPGTVWTPEVLGRIRDQTTLSPLIVPHVGYAEVFFDSYFASVPLGEAPACGPPVTADNVTYFASVSDWNAFNVSSTMYRGGAEMTFGSDFAPVLEHFPRDTFPVPPPPVCAVP